MAAKQLLVLGALAGLSAAQNSHPPAWPTSVHFTGNVTSTSTFNGISSPAIRGRTENWLACSATSPLSALVRGDTTTTAYGVDALITSLIQTCSGTPMQYTSVRVPMLPVSPICTAQAIPSIFCGKCPTYGTTALDCTGWTSSTTTIKGRPAMHYIATGCKNNSITTAGIAQNLQTLAELWYPSPAAPNSQPLKVVQTVRLWESMSGQSLQSVTSSEIEFLTWAVGSPPSGIFNHCIPSSAEELAKSNLTAAYFTLNGRFFATFSPKTGAF